MKFLFITGNLFMEHLGVMYLSSVLKKTGMDVDSVKISEDVDSKMRKFGPDVVGYSVITGNQNKFLELNSNLKKKYKFVSIMGGPHPTFFPDVLKNEDLDYILRGEGEKAILNFLAYLKNEAQIEKVSNLSYKLKDKKIVHNPLLKLIDNLDELPFPDRDIFFKYREIYDCPIKHFIASRGCPFGCSYCFNDKYYQLYSGLGRRVRFRSVENLICEIEEVSKLSRIGLVYFQDDTFVLDKRWLSEFADLYRSRINLPYHCHVRPNLADEETISLLKSSNCYSVHIAVETSDDYIRNQLLKRNLEKKQILDACRLLSKYKIKFMLQNIIGLPEGNINTDLDTLRLNIECSPTYAWVSIYQPYPGTPLADYAVKKGFFDGNYDYLSDNFFDTTLMRFSNSYKKRIGNLQKVFAIIVRYPIIYYSLAYKLLLILPRLSIVKNILKKMYLKFRERSDYQLYGIKI